LLYKETADDQEFDTFCQTVVSEVTIYPEFVSLLQLISEQKYIGAVVITSGLRRIWDKVLEREGLSKIVQVIGRGRIADGFVVTGTIKGALVLYLRDAYQIYVWGFGDSPLDLDILSKADQAIVVVGKEQTRSKTMDTALANTIDHDGLRVRQTLLPSNTSPRLDTARLYLIQLTNPEFVDSVLGGSSRYTDPQIVYTTDTNAARLLMIPTRDATVAGPVLRNAHGRVG